MATIQQVAKLAGVSAGSVSRYLNGYRLKEKNEQAIEQAIHELDYRPNYLARSLRKSKSMSVGLLVNNMLNHFATGVIAQIEHEMELRDYSLVLSGFRNDEAVFGSKLQMMLERRVDGLIIFEGVDSWAGNELLEGATIPVIALGTALGLPNVDSILVDDYTSSHDIVARMIASGHERVGIIAGKQAEYVSRERLRGCLAAFDEAGLSREHARVFMGDYSVLSGYQGMSQLLDEGVDCVYAANYGTGQGALQAIAERSLLIGEDVSFATHDYFEMNILFYPQITTVYSPSHEMGSVAAERMLKMIDEGAAACGERITLENAVAWRPSIKGMAL